MSATPELKSGRFIEVTCIHCGQPTRSVLYSVPYEDPGLWINCTHCDWAWNVGD